MRRDRGSIHRLSENILDLILGPLHRQASSVGYALYGCNKLIKDIEQQKEIERYGRHRERHSERHSERYKERHSERDSERYSERETVRETMRETVRETVR